MFRGRLGWRAVAIVCSLLVTSCQGAANVVDPAAVLDGFVAAVDAGDADAALATFSTDATWTVNQLQVSLNEPLPPDLTGLAGIMSLPDDPAGSDLVAAWIELLAIAETDMVISSCTTEGATLVCDYAMLDLLSAATGGGERGRMTVVANGEAIAQMTLAPTPPSEPPESGDDFRRWAAIHDEDSMRTMSLFDSTRLLVGLVKEWEAAGRPDIDRPSLATDDPIAIVEAWLEARNSRDWPTLIALTGGDALVDPFASRDEFDAAELLNRVITPTFCSVQDKGAATGSFVACEVEVTDIVVDAAGTTSTNLNQSTFRVTGGRVVAVPQYIPSSFVAERAIEEWARAELPGEFAAACPDGIAGQSPIDGKACAQFVADHLEDWRPVVEALGLSASEREQ